MRPDRVATDTNIPSPPRSGDDVLTAEAYAATTAGTFQRDLSACRDMLRHGSRTFFAASFLLPKRVREPASALYAFCRLADDLIDLSDDSAKGLEVLRGRLDRAYRGTPDDHPADRAFAETVKAFDIPRALPEALLEGFAWDAMQRQYETLDDVQAYGARVAGTVGAMMALLMNRRSAVDLARATDLGIAMQLTNIARDVGEDARLGRLYLPRQWLRDEAIDPDSWLQNPQFSPALGRVIQRLLDVAEMLYARAGQGIARLPADCRPGIYAARYMYAGIGHELVRQGHNSVAQRAVVPTSRKLKLLARAIAATPVRRPGQSAASLAAAAFLVAAAARPEQVMTPDYDSPWWDIHGKAIILVDILEKVEQRELAARQNRQRSHHASSLAIHARGAS